MNVSLDILEKIFKLTKPSHSLFQKAFLKGLRDTPRLIFEKTHFSSFSCHLITLKHRVTIPKLPTESLGLTEAKKHNECQSVYFTKKFQANETST